MDAETTASAKIPAPVIIVVAATLGFGIFADRWLARRTRRRVNIGLVIGGLAIAIMIVWVGTALAISRRQPLGEEHRRRLPAHGDQPRHHRPAGPRRRDAVADPARRRGFAQTLYYQRVDQMRQQLGDYLARKDTVDKSGLAQTDQLLDKWRQADRADQRLHRGGQHQSATEVALGTGEGDSTAAFDKLNDALVQGIQQSRTQLRSDILSARRVLSGTTVGGALLSVGAALAVALGLWPRMSEYR